MPTLETLQKHPVDILISSMGGSVVRPDRLHQSVVEDFAEFCNGLIKQNKTGIFVIGGGGQARKVIEDAQDMGVTNLDELDKLGIQVTWQNVFMLRTIFTAKGISVGIRGSGDQPQSGLIYLQGGGEPGHTTDFEAVKAAGETGQNLVVNVSNTPGLHPTYHDGTLNTSEIIPKLNWDTYLSMFELEHIPGRNLPFDTAAAALAREHNITVVLSGADFANVYNCISGNSFHGTVIAPESSSVTS